MEKTREFLKNNKSSFEQYDYLKDYEVLFEAIENKKTPDHSIEACKALLEGLAKTIISQVDITLIETSKRFDEQDFKNLRALKSQLSTRNYQFQDLVRQSIVVLAAFHHGCEKDFLLGFSSKFFSTIAKIRDRRGDVSHGRTVPKQDKSSMTLSYMVESITDVITLHMLEVFTLVDFSVDQEVDAAFLIKESFMVKPESDLLNIGESEKLIRAFNKELDLQNPMSDGLSFSEALYSQKEEEYLILLNDFEYEQKSEDV